MNEPRRPVPSLRPLDCTLLQAGGRELVRVRDGLGISPDAAVPLPLFALAQLFDGSRDLVEVQAEITRQTGEVFPGTELARIVRELDEAYLLDSPRFQERLREVLEEWGKSTVRPAVHAGPGRCYSDRPEGLEREMEEMYHRPGAAGPAVPSSSERPSSGRPLKAALAPHIDFQRGGHCYTWAYQEVRRRGTVPLYVVLGTSHQPMEGHFAITRKGYGTPWGPVAADREFLDDLERRTGSDLGRDELNHKNEHSIEFQVVFLRHTLGAAPFSIAPILCGGFHASVMQGVEPQREPAVAQFLDALAECIASARAAGREVVVIGGVDLAHVGRHFGDADPLTPEFLEEVRRQDRRLLERAAAVDSRGFFEEIARDRDRRRICGFGPIYTLLAVLERLEGKWGGSAGRLLSYDQAVDLENDLCVSFASMAFEDR